MMYTEITTRAHCRSSLGRHAFTLIELLVVIAIIAILAGILIPGVQTAMRGAEIRKARLEISSIVTACQSYYSEYGVWPCAGWNGHRDDQTFHATGAVSTHTNSQALVMGILTGVNTNQNRRRITFLEIREESMTGTDKDTNPYTPASGYYLDPWGNPYIIAFDNNFDEEVDLAALSANDNWRPTNSLPRARIAVYSLGPAATANERWRPLSNADKLKSAILSWKD